MKLIAIARAARVRAHELFAYAKGQWVAVKTRLLYGGRVRIGARLRVYGPLPIIHCSNGGTIVLGDDIVMRNSTEHNFVGIIKPVSIVAVQDGVIRIGRRVGLSGTSISCYSEIVIGDYSTIGANVFITDSDFHSMDPIQRVVDADGGTRSSAAHAHTRAVRIGRNAFIGLNAIVLAGSRIDENGVLGAGAVLRGEVLANEIVVGSGVRKIPKKK